MFGPKVNSMNNNKNIVWMLQTQIFLTVQSRMTNHGEVIQLNVKHKMSDQLSY